MTLRQRWEAWRSARRGQAHYRAGRAAEAAAEYAQALSLAPADIACRLNYGLALYHSGQRQDARAAWQSALTRAEDADKFYLAEQARILLRQFG